MNDVFIFLVTNLETKISENIAILNGDKNIPITVDHINLKTNSEYYIANSPWEEVKQRKNNNNLKEIELSHTYQYDGFTKVLVAKAKVTPHVKYHLKLGISDVGDQLYDSAIFLKSNSLRSSGNKPIQKEHLPKPKIHIKNHTIEFKYNAPQITDDHSFKQLDKIVSYLKNDPQITVKITGHTDSIGSDNFNKSLSLKRANAVKRYFLSKKIDTRRIIINGMGEKSPKSKLASQNRRVEIELSIPDTP
ncbi:OmpA/MotB [unidentified eubacterium SCB49]|nr:OmpA/MotB [unidentified eubacterium SCB49]